MYSISSFRWSLFYNNFYRGFNWNDLCRLCVQVSFAETSAQAWAWSVLTLDKRINSSKVLSEYCFPQVLDRDDDEEWVVTDVIEEATELDSATLEVRTLLCRVLRKRRKQPERPKWWRKRCLYKLWLVLKCYSQSERAISSFLFAAAGANVWLMATLLLFRA